MDIEMTLCKEKWYLDFKLPCTTFGTIKKKKKNLSNSDENLMNLWPIEVGESLRCVKLWK